MKVFLTGGTGFIGKPLTQALLRRGWQVTALVRRPESADAGTLQAMGAQLAPGDINDVASMRGPMAGADIVIHNAGWYEMGLSRRAQLEMKAINVDGAKNVLGLAVELGIPRIVHISSIVAIGPTGPTMVDENHQRQQPPLTLYDATKTEAHEIARQLQSQGAPVIIASLGAAVGPGDHSTMGYYARLYVRGLCMPVLATGSRGTVHVEDCAEGIALAAEKGRVGENYIISGEVISLKEMYEVWKKTPGGPKFMFYLPRRLGEVICAMIEPVQRLAGLPNVFSKEVFTAGSVHLNYSGAKAERELGARFRDARQAWHDTLEAERERMRDGKSWRYTG
jgi:dihydroflavonol-4-reductase